VSRDEVAWSSLLSRIFEILRKSQTNKRADCALAGRIGTFCGTRHALLSILMANQKHLCIAVALPFSGDEDKIGGSTIDGIFALKSWDSASPLLTLFSDMSESPPPPPSQLQSRASPHPLRRVIAVVPIMADTVDFKWGNQLCATVSQPSIQPDEVVRPMDS